MSDSNSVAVLVNTFNRPTEIYGLVISLWMQSYKNWNLYVMDDASGTDINSFHFLNVLFARLRHEGHRVDVLRNKQSLGVSVARQRLVEHVLQNGSGELTFCRCDDDCIMEQDYLAKLLKVISAGYDIASGVTPPIMNPLTLRNVSFVSPVINRAVFDKEGNWLFCGDDCGYTHNHGIVLPADHFRSSALIKREVHEKVKYDLTFTKCGFREETMFSFKAILAGFKIGVHTRAKIWHVMTPSGGDRRGDYNDLALQNQKILNRWVRNVFEEQGDFIKEYHKKLGISEDGALKNVSKRTNLIFSQEV